MKMSVTNPQELGVYDCKYTQGKAQKVLRQFMESGNACMELHWGSSEYSNVKSVTAPYHRAASRGCFPIVVRMRKGRVFLVRKECINHD